MHLFCGSSTIENYAPILWKRARVTPVPKTSPPNVDELRPISLLLAFEKVLEKAVYAQFKRFPTSSGG